MTREVVVPPARPLNVGPLSRGAPLADQPPHVLGYASPRTPRQPFPVRSRHVAAATGAVAWLAVMFVPATVGSGIVRLNPTAAFACFAVMAGAILYVWLRLFEDAPRSAAATAVVGICATVAIVALPFQFWTLANDYGDPRPWVRLKLYAPGVIVLAALSLAAVTRGTTRRWSGPARRGSL